jgi:NAD(P)-dependent dehydrogenase (short-subunit alcohol dehydrogenase family)
MGIWQKIALITGAGSGLGRAAALEFARQGAFVVLCGRRLNKIRETGQLIAADGGTALPVQTDISDEAQVASLVETALKQYGRIDILINNAAVFEAAGFLETSPEAWEYQLKINATGAFLTMKACLPHMIRQNYGRIVNITSGLAYNGAGGFAAYGASKAALESLTRTVADEMEAYDILVNLYNPGMIKTEMHATGKDPSAVVQDLVYLADLPRRGITGRLLEAAL